MTSEPLIELKDLRMHFEVRESVFSTKMITVRAVDGINFSIQKGETFGLVGESGCGKSTTGRCVIRLYTPTSGQIIYEGEDITNLKRGKLQRLRRQIQMIFQDPWASLNPRMKVGDIIGEPILVHKLAKKKERQEAVFNLLETAGLAPDHYYRFPHEFSGGQRQRIGIARALSLNPRLIICDEPVSALDVSIQAQILNLLHDLQQDLDLTYLFIAHDLSVIRHVSDHVGVMYVGKIVETAEKEVIFDKPFHPYTEALLSAVPSRDPDIKKDRIILEGDVANPAAPPPGCRFHPRCRYATDICKDPEKEPVLEDLGKGHLVACHHPLNSK